MGGCLKTGKKSRSAGDESGIEQVEWTESANSTPRTPNSSNTPSLSLSNEQPTPTLQSSDSPPYQQISRSHRKNVNRGRSRKGRKAWDEKEKEEDNLENLTFDSTPLTSLIHDEDHIDNGSTIDEIQTGDLEVPPSSSKRPPTCPSSAPSSSSSQLKSDSAETPGDDDDEMNSNYFFARFEECSSDCLEDDATLSGISAGNTALTDSVQTTEEEIP